jgi:hypothetical protein
MKLIMLSFMLSVTHVLLAQEQSESFVIYAYDHSYKVVAPERFAPGVTAVLENKTLGPLRGKFQKRNGTLIQHIAIAPQSTISVDLKLKENEQAYFVPFVPAFQEVELKFGSRAYQIPPIMRK